VNSFVTGAAFVHGRSRSPQLAVIPLRPATFEWLVEATSSVACGCAEGRSSIHGPGSACRISRFGMRTGARRRVGLFQVRSVNRALERVPDMR
jgi:hypothetical protein